LRAMRVVRGRPTTGAARRGRARAARPARLAHPPHHRLRRDRHALPAQRAEHGQCQRQVAGLEAPRRCGASSASVPHGVSRARAASAPPRPAATSSRAGASRGAERSAAIRAITARARVHAVGRHHRHAGLQDAGLLRRDLLDGAPEDLGVIEPDAR
jgi:hypothetical protein